mgnify:FL=1
MDKKLHLKAIKKLIKKFFQLESVPITWAIDEHYTTEPQTLNAIFDDDSFYEND